MSHCHDEHHGHSGHDHSHDGEHDHSDDITPALQSSLYEHIDFDHITTLNEETSGSGKAIVQKTWAQRMDEEPELASDADEQLILNIPLRFFSNIPPQTPPPSNLIANITQPRFTSQIKLHALLLRTSPSPSAPKTVRVIINRDDVDFSNASDIPATQEFELSLTSEIQEIPVKRAKFGAVRRISLFFVDNFSDGEDDVTRLSYVGFKGELGMQLGRAPSNILYEAAANPNDHKVKGVGVNEMGSHIG